MWTCLRQRQVAGRDVILTRHGKVHVGRSHAFSPSCCRSKCIATPVEWMRGRSLAIPLSVILVAHVKLNQPVEVVQSSRECCHSRLKTVRTWLLFPLTQPVFFSFCSHFTKGWRKSLGRTSCFYLSETLATPATTAIKFRSSFSVIIVGSDVNYHHRDVN